LIDERSTLAGNLDRVAGEAQLQGSPALVIEKRRNLVGQIRLRLCAQFYAFP